MIMTAKLPEPDLNYLQRVLLEMLAIPSPTGFTDTIVRYVAERLKELGIPFELTRAPGHHRRQRPGNSGQWPTRSVPGGLLVKPLRRRQPRQRLH